MKKNPKKPLLITLALVLVCAASAAGTLAYLTRQTGPVTNTFVAAGLATLTLQESEAVPVSVWSTDPPSTDDPDPGVPAEPTLEPKSIRPGGASMMSKSGPLRNSGASVLPGYYTLNTANPTTGNDYTVVPGVDLPKDPKITVKELEVPAYLFLEAVDTTDEDITWNVEDGWIKLSNKTGKNGGEVYAYSGQLNPSATDQVFYVIKGNEVKVSGRYEPQNEQNTQESLTFYAYLCQADGFSGAEDAWEAVFGA